MDPVGTVWVPVAVFRDGVAVVVTVPPDAVAVVLAVAVGVGGEEKLPVTLSDGLGE
jgi:hypothetical protein